MIADEASLAQLMAASQKGDASAYRVLLAEIQLEPRRLQPVEQRPVDLHRLRGDPLVRLLHRPQRQGEAQQRGEARRPQNRAPASPLCPTRAGRPVR